MRGEHDLSEYCLQDEGSSQADSDAKPKLTHDGESESLAWAEEHHAPHDVPPVNSHGDGVGDDSDDAFGVLGRWQGGSEHAQAKAPAAGAPNSAKGVGGWRSHQGEEARDSEEEGDEGDNEQEDRWEDIAGNGEDVGPGSVYFEEECQRLALSLGPSGDLSRQIDFAGHVEPSRSDYSPPNSEKKKDADINKYNVNGFSASHERLAVVAERTTGREGEGGATSHISSPQKPPIMGYVRGSSTFFPETDDDDDDGGSICDTIIYPSPVTAATAKVTRKGHLSGYGGDSGIFNRRKSSGVSEEILTAGARALAEAASMITQQGEEGGGGGEYRLGPDEATPTTNGAYAASTAATCAGYQRRQRWPHTVVVDGEPTPRLYGGTPDTSYPAAVAGVDGRACSPAGVEDCFGTDSTHRPTLSLSSTELSGGGVVERQQMRSGRCESGSLLKEGFTLYPMPRYKATVADVQEAFERADTRVARGAAQNPLSDNSEGGGQRNRQLRGEGGVGGGQALKVIGRVAGLETGRSCNDEVRPTGFLFPTREWIRCSPFVRFC